VDEAQAALGLARAEAPAGSEVDGLLIGLERELYVLMAELTTLPENRGKLKPGESLVTKDMVEAVERTIDELTGRFPPLTGFVVPGQDRLSAALDVARTVIRRAERAAVGVADPGSLIGMYLNRLSDLVWTVARWQEHGASLPARGSGPVRGSGRGGAIGSPGGDIQKTTD
jgi:cob(I)alamin adenosyltransferase